MAGGFRRVLSTGAGVLSASLLVMYPVLAYVGLSYWEPRVTALVLLGLLLPIGIGRLARARRAQLRGLAWLPVVPLSALGLAAWLNSQGFVLLVPVVISSGFLLAFGLTLRRGPPMVERLARLQDPNLSASEVAWCRLWTQLWCAFFFLNAATALLLGQLGELKMWTHYTGLIAYLVMGLLFAVEYVMRKYRFGRLRGHFLDRQLKRTFARLGRSA